MLIFLVKLEMFPANTKFGGLMRAKIDFSIPRFPSVAQRKELNGFIRELGAILYLPEYKDRLVGTCATDIFFSAEIKTKSYNDELVEKIAPILEKYKGVSLTVE